MSYLLDDFSDAEVSCLGTRWLAFSDQVMGGASEVQMAHTEYQGRACLQLTGQIRSDNRGGFVLAALPLVPSRLLFDASAYQGVYLVSCSPQPAGHYRLQLRSRELSMPWQHFWAELQPTAEWQRFEIPFDSFQASHTHHSLNTHVLTRVGLAGVLPAESAEIYLAEIGFY